MTLQEIISNIVESVKQSFQEKVDIRVGTVLRDVIINPIANAIFLYTNI